MSTIRFGPIPRGKGFIKADSHALEKLANFDDVKANIEIKWQKWNEEKKIFEPNSKKYEEKDIKAITIYVNPGDVISMRLETFDKTDIIFPLRSVNLELADYEKNWEESKNYVSV